MFYDDRYRVIQTVADNHLNGIDRTSSHYDFMGKVLETKTTHSDGTNAPSWPKTTPMTMQEGCLS